MSQPDLIDRNDGARPGRHYRHPSGEHGRVLGVFNRKGGTAKSTTAVNVAAIAADWGHDVLLVDLDDQGTVTQWLGHNPAQTVALMEVLDPDLRRPVDEAVVDTPVPRLQLLPGSTELMAISERLSKEPTALPQLALRRALARARRRDLVVLDTPGDLGLVTVLAAAAAGEVLISIPPEVPNVRALPELEKLLVLVRERELNPELTLTGVVATRVPFVGRHMEGQARDLLAQLRAHFGELMLTSVVTENQVHGLAMDAGMPVSWYEQGHRGDVEYRRVVAELGISAPEAVANGR
jgi:chromosome partitioning protein